MSFHHHWFSTPDSNKELAAKCSFTCKGEWEVVEKPYTQFIEEPTFFLRHTRVRVVNHPGGITQKYPYIIFAWIGFFRWVWKSVGLGPRKGLFWELGPRMRQISLIHLRGEEAPYCKRFINLSRALLSVILYWARIFTKDMAPSTYTRKTLEFLYILLKYIVVTCSIKSSFSPTFDYGLCFCAACSYVLWSSGSKGTSNKHWIWCVNANYMYYALSLFVL
jgi:hypothetical protein